MAPSTGALVVFGLIAVALVPFVTESLAPDITAVGVLVSLSVLEPVTCVPAEEAIAGFASPAVVAIIGTDVLGGAVEETGVVAVFVPTVGYQTNPMVYGPGAYRFTDYARVGAPLLAGLAVVTTLGIVGIYGL